jgi:carbamate kinase
MRLVIALGGNALLKRGEPMTASLQRANVRRAAVSLSSIVAAGHQIVITHGNGPQVGLIALQAAAGPKDGIYPLDILGAESEGMIGYLIEQELRNALPEGTLMATLLTQIRVNAGDPAFRHPSKPIGPVLDAISARRVEAEHGWQTARDGDNWRRVVASPEPIEILEMPVISILVEQGVIVICAGGGGIPVKSDDQKRITGVEAVIDKDHASALLARQINADSLLLLTDVDAVYLEFGTPSAHRISRTGAASLAPDQFASGSMRPKLEAALSFVTLTGRPAAIGCLDDAMAILHGEAGTTIIPGSSEPTA